MRLVLALSSAGSRQRFGQAEGLGQGYSVTEAGRIDRASQTGSIASLAKRQRRVSCALSAYTAAMPASGATRL